ncbi:MAG TPA: ATP synthase F0 subunit B [Pseudacidobacterium sp.]|jgi:F-type H+-transporting ATPase subunit b|nr:ATP synthase F0 subunit B [Pseudacidobacterium sp.]
MDEILRQLGDLALGSVPTTILFLFLVISYRFLVYGPLSKTLAERRERTRGAVEKAQAAIAAADAKSQEYEAKLRAARADIFRHREQRVQQWNTERDHALASARLMAQERVRAAQTVIAQQGADARKQIEGSTEQLASQILQAILPAGVAPVESVR